MSDGRSDGTAYPRLVGRFDEEGPVPAGYVMRLRYSSARQQELRDAATDERDAKKATGRQHRRRWWPFGKRRAT
jgi:hypothetical protein